MTIFKKSKIGKLQDQQTQSRKLPNFTQRVKLSLRFRKSSKTTQDFSAERSCSIHALITRSYHTSRGANIHNAGTDLNYICLLSSRLSTRLVKPENITGVWGIPTRHQERCRKPLPPVGLQGTWREESGSHYLLQLSTVRGRGRQWGGGGKSQVEKHMGSPNG